MKKLLLLSTLAICSCSIINDFLSEPTETTALKATEQRGNVPAKINEKCENIPAVKIFQVLDNFSLANTCEKSEYSDNLSCYGLTVYVPKKEGNIYYDDQIIKPSKKQCISFDGTYQYVAGIGELTRLKTVPIIKMIKKYKQ